MAMFEFCSYVLLIHISPYTHTYKSCIFYTGVLCQSLTAPTEICPGDDVTFTCVVDLAVFWRVTPGGDDEECVYRSGNPDVTATCGPDQRFTSSRTDMSQDINNSSLSVVSITNDLNETLVECADINNELVDSYNICIVGR